MATRLDATAAGSSKPRGHGRKSIAIFDYLVTPTNPAGSCHLRMLESLSGEYEFTVFAVEFTNPCPDRIQWVRVPALRRPLALLFVTYHLLAPIYFKLHQLRTGHRYDVVQTIEDIVLYGNLAYVHFCHRAYLRDRWRETGATGLRGFARWLDHSLRAGLEPIAYRRAKRIVVPSQGLADELTREFPFLRDRIEVVPNPVDLERMRPPCDFDRDELRRALHIAPGDTALVFVALGHFERKGLPVLLEALARLDRPDVKLVVVGGQPDLVAAYRRQTSAMGLRGRVLFVGMQHDVRRFFWATDAFVLPSSYEVFSLAAIEAAAAGLPIITTRLHGVSEYLEDGRNGFFVERTPRSVLEGIERFLMLSTAARATMGRHGRNDVKRFDREHFVANWRAIYGSDCVA